ncbi:MAG: hypothetical protein AB1458_15335 [Bacteroidota bacterium]
MKTTDDLFQLVHSMSMQEKRYFKIAASFHSRKGGSNSIRLFDAIEKQKQYDEEKIRAAFRGETFLRHLPSEKNYLYALIRKILRQYHAQDNTDIAIKELLIDAEVLHAKSLYAHCRKILKKAKQLAYRYERFAFIPEIVRMESRLYDMENLRAVYAEELAVLRKIERINRYRTLSNRVASLVATAHFQRSRKEVAEFEKVMRHPLMRDETRADSYTAKIYFFYIRGVYYEMKGDLRKSYLTRRRFVKISESYPEQLEIHTKNYLSALNNLAISELDLRRYDDAMRTVARMKAVPSAFRAGRAEDIRITSFLFSAIMELNIYIRTGEFEKGLPAAKEAERQLKASEGRILRDAELRTEIHNSIKYIYFGAGDLKKSLFWSNRVIQESPPGIRQDIQAMARIFNLVLHYELGNTDLLEHIIRSTYRFLLRSQRLFRVETILLNYLRRSAWLSTRKEVIASFRELHKELLPLRKDRYESKAFEEFDILSWLESKIEGRTFGAVVRGKV